VDGNQTRHGYYREKICEFMRTNRPDFEPFIVDQTFDAFIRSLSKDGTFGGNECLVAFSRLYDTKICIHQVIIPRACCRKLRLALSSHSKNTIKLNGSFMRSILFK
jgi:hypothetical protein